jgi:inner membrane protein involved in colicin E2 resistance
VTASRLFAIGFIFCCVSVGWMVLGGTVVQRTGEFDGRLAQEVGQLWGGSHNQIAPDAKILRPRVVTEFVKEKDSRGQEVERARRRTEYDDVPMLPEQSRVSVDMDLDQRRKGLLWYNTYAVTFAARYKLRNPDDAARTALVHLAFPSAEAIYDGFAFRVNGVEAASISDLRLGITARAELPARGEALVEVAYKSRGLGDWTYSFAPSGVTQVRDFALEMTTDFRNIDFPAGTLSPSARAPQGPGFALKWRFDSLVTGQRVGMNPPNRLNPGPLAARITFFAPVGLLFFLTVMVMLGVLRGRSLHPMNYFFLAAAFFAFHLLLAYLVDHVQIHAAFAIASAASIVLVVSYLRLVCGLRVAIVEAGVAQLVFLVLFSYAFFFEGFTGLTVTVGAVLTLFVLMQLTGRVEWSHVLGRKPEAQSTRP